jgi:hypothetical protein
MATKTLRVFAEYTSTGFVPMPTAGNIDYGYTLGSTFPATTPTTFQTDNPDLVVTVTAMTDFYVWIRVNGQAWNPSYTRNVRVYPDSPNINNVVMNMIIATGPAGVGAYTQLVQTSNRLYFNGATTDSIYNSKFAGKTYINELNFGTAPGLATVATSGAYADLTGKPTLATVATSGLFTDLSSKPSGTAPLSYNSGTNSFVITQANTSTNGYLSSTDWNTFNNKFATPAGTTLQYVTGNGTLATFPLLASADKLVITVRNSSGVSMPKGSIVYINGATGNKPTIALSQANSDATSAQTLGLLQSTLANNAEGNVIIVGAVTDLNTSAFTEGQQLYLSPTTAGAYTATKQYAPNHLVYVGIVSRSHVSLGVIEVKVQNGYEMDELHDVSAQSPSNNDGLFYNTTTSLWEKKSIATVLGYTPYNGTDTSIKALFSASAPLSYSNGVYGISQATTSSNGYLSSTDWNTFNSKTSNLGTVTSVAMSTPLGLSISGSPITISGTLALTFSAGYSLPSDATQATWTAKQSALNGTGFVKISGTTISYDNTSYLPLSGGLMTNSIQFSDTTNLKRGIYGSMGTDDNWFIGANASGVSQGYLEIATGDDGTEPIYVTQYTGNAYTTGTVLRRVKILDESGNSIFPNSLTANSLIMLGGTSSQFLKANGTVDNNVYLTTSSAASTYQTIITNPVTGTGTTNYISKFTSGSAIGISQIFDNGTNIGIGITNPTRKFMIFGETSFFNGAPTDGAINGGNSESITIGFNLAPVSSQDISRINVTLDKWKVIIRGGYANNGEGGGLVSQSLEIELDSSSPTINAGSTSITFSRNSSTSKLQATNNSVDRRVTFVGTIQIIDYPQSLLPTSSKVILGNVSIGNTNNTFKLDVTGTTRVSGVLTLSSTISNGTFTYTLPSATGTFALTSALSGYLPLTGGTLTGALGGTSATFSSSVTATSLIKSGGTSAQFLMADGSVSTLTNPVTGTGTTNYIPKFTSASAIGNSTLQEVSGNLGLGVTPSAWSGYTVLQNSGGSLIGATGELQLWQNAFFNGTSSIYVATQTATRYSMSGGQHRWFNAPSGTDGTAITWTQAMTLFANGNLAVGTTTDSGYKLDVSGTARVSGNVSIGTSRLLLYTDTPPGANASTKMGYMFSTIGTTGSTPAGSFIEDVATGTILSYGVNVPQAGARDTAYVGGIFRLDTRASNQEFTVRAFQTGSSSEVTRISINLQTGNTLLAPVAGNVLIGTTTDSGYKLNVNGSLTSTSLFVNGSGTTLKGGDGGSGTEIVRMTKFDNSVAMIVIGNGFVGINTTTVGSRFQVNGNAAIGYSASTAAPTNGLLVAGNVGIGTTSPDAPLDVVRGSTGTVATFGIEGLTNNPRLRIDADETNNTVTLNPNYSGATSPSLVFKTQEIERMRITSLGVVGIAVTPITDPYTATGGGWKTIQFGKGGILGAYATDNESMSGFNTYVTTDGSNKAIISNIGGTAIRYYEDRITFNTLSTSGTAQTQTERVRINSTGLGIGTTAPQLLVASGLGIEISSAAGSSLVLSKSGNPSVDYGGISYDGNTRIHANGFIGFSLSGTRHITIHNNGNMALNTTSDNGYKLYVAGTIYATGNITANSDLTLKKNLKLIDNPINKLMQLNGYAYQWKANDEHQYGVIAQEVEKILPYAVSTGYDGIKGVSYNQIIPVLIEAIKTQQAEINTLKSKLA